MKGSKTDLSHRDELVNAVTKHLSNGSYTVEFREPYLVELTFHTPVKLLGQLVQVKEFLSISERDLRCIAVMPFSVRDDSKKPLAAEYLSRVNWHLQTGWFAMDYSDGEVRACMERSHVDSLPTEADFRMLVMAPVTLVSQYMAGLILTIQDSGTPKENAERFTPDALK